MRTFRHTISRIKIYKLTTGYVNFCRCPTCILHIQQEAGTLSIKHSSFKLSAGNIDNSPIHYIDKVRSFRIKLLVVEVTTIDINYSIVISPHSHAITIDIRSLLKSLDLTLTIDCKMRIPGHIENNGIISINLCLIDNAMSIKVNDNIRIAAENQRIIDFNVINEFRRTTGCDQCLERLRIFNIDKVNVIVRLIENRDDFNIENHL